MLILVRHAMPEVDPAVRPEEWELSAEGRRAAAGLCARLPSGLALVSSVEPKAWQTLEPAGPVTRDPGFNEVARDEPFDGDFKARRRSYVEGADLPGWEPRERVVARFDAAVSKYPQCVIASHGMAMTLWLAARVGLTDPGDFWATLRLPDALVINVDGQRVTRI